MSSELAISPIEQLAELQQHISAVHTNALQHLSQFKADRAEVRRLEAEVASLEAKVHVLQHGRDHITVVALASMLKVEFQSNSDEGKLLTALSKRLCLPVEKRADDRFGSINCYHPFVCKFHCEDQGYKLPASLKFVVDPR